MIRTPIRRVSKKRLREAKARRAVREAVVARDVSCMFWPMVTDYIASTSDLSAQYGHPICDGDLVPHEPAHSRNVGRLTVDDCIALCVIHNGYVETMGQLAYDCGLLVKGNGLPLRHSNHVEAAS